MHDGWQGSCLIGSYLCNGMSQQPVPLRQTHDPEAQGTAVMSLFHFLRQEDLAQPQHSA